MNSSIVAGFPDPGHNHQHCIRNALQEAERLCQKRNVRFTANRRRVLELIWRNHRPATPYYLLQQLTHDGQSVQAPMVYRCLEFLLELGLVHKVASQNAYVGCVQPRQEHEAELLICDVCGTVAELADNSVNRSLSACARQQNFNVQHRIVELTGTCEHCTRDRHDG